MFSVLRVYVHIYVTNFSQAGTIAFCNPDLQLLQYQHSWIQFEATLDLDLLEDDFLQAHTPLQFARGSLGYGLEIAITIQKYMKQICNNPICVSFFLYPCSTVNNAIQWINLKLNTWYIYGRYQDQFLPNNREISLNPPIQQASKSCIDSLQDQCTLKLATLGPVPTFPALKRPS